MIKSFAILLLASGILTTAFAAPIWVNEGSKGCKTSELCAVGIGDTASAAERNAKISLAKIFETNISSSLNTSLSSHGKEVSESMSEDIAESTAMALEGVEIKKRDEDKTGYYALAVINKSKAGDGFKREIETIDAKMSVIMKNDEAVSKIQLEKLFVKRETLDRRYKFLTNKSIKSPYSAENIFTEKNKAIGKVIVHIYLDEDEPKSVEATLAKATSDLGYQSTTGRVRNKLATHVMTGEFISEEQYMQVAGNVKFKFILKLQLMRAGTKVESGSLHFETIETGRNFANAYANALPSVQEYIKTNIDKLNFR